MEASVQRGQLFIPFAYWEAAANKLTGHALDPFGKIPGFKVTAVRIRAKPATPGSTPAKTQPRSSCLQRMRR